MKIDRRVFLQQCGWSVGVLALGFSGVHRLMAGGAPTLSTGASGFGPLVADPNGLLDLPRGFTARIISKTGEEMADGLMVPGKQDGMAAFPGPDGRILLVRNHENEYPWRPLGPYGLLNERFSQVDTSLLYDARDGKLPCLGGCSVLVYNPATGQTEKEFLRLAGTERNCAGGPTPWGTWITCEESEVKAEPGSYREDHGFPFEVTPTMEPGLERAVPLKAMGRFRREAVAVDPATGIVYQTEDLGDGCLYRFIPKNPGKLVDGGRLQALVIKGAPQDTRNAPGSTQSFPLNRPVRIDWVDVDDPEAPANDLRFRAQEDGAAIFARGEGIWTGQGEIYFACTTGGPQMFGQIFRLRLGQPETLELFVESHDSALMQNADNLVIAPWGDVIVCEDSSAPHKRLVGITPQGEFYHLARCAYNSSELAGACFSPDGKTLFVNIQNNPGLTLAVTGPWPTPS